MHTCKLRDMSIFCGMAVCNHYLYNFFFILAVHCTADNTSDVVPIAVGCALAGLVVIVLIAYLVGRRRRSAAYQSV